MTKLLFILTTTLSSIVMASECRQVTFTAQEHEVLADHNNDMVQACSAAGKNALWKACVICTSNVPNGDSCKAGKVESLADHTQRLCNGNAEAKAFPCGSPTEFKSTKEMLVHCVGAESAFN